MTHTGINTPGIQRVRDHLAHVPRPDREAHLAIGRWLRSQGISLDPNNIDVVTLHLQRQASGRYHAQIVQRIRLPQAVLINWQGESANNLLGALFAEPWAGHFPTDGAIDVVEALDPLPVLSNQSPYLVFNGLFQHREPVRFDTSTLIEVAADTLQHHLEDFDFHTRYKTQLERFWQAHLDEHRLCCKLNFIAACNKQVAEGSLSDAARRLAWQTADLLPRSTTLRASLLNIYGYVATDLLCLHETHDGLTVLYVPGNSAPLLEFASLDLLRDWVGEQCKDAVRRAELKRHFRLADGPQGVEFSGLDTALEGLGAYPRTHRLPPEHGFFNDDGRWAPRTYVHYRPDTYSPAIGGDPFQALAERQRRRSLDDADFLITSNEEIRKHRWRHYLDSTLTLLLPVSFVVPGLAPLLAVGGIVQLGLGLDEAINGKTLDAKLDGIGTATYGLFNAVPGVAQIAHEATDALFQTWHEGFVVPSRLNGQIGYPLSPLDPPRLPDLDVAPYFHSQLRIEPLAHGDPAVAEAVSRLPRYDGTLDALQGYYEPVEGYVETLDLVYDMETNLFLRQEDVNAVQPRYYEPEPGTGNMRRASAAHREVTHAMRTATLRGLGIDLPLPLDLPALVPEGATPIPRQITSLWVGDRRIDEQVLDTLAHNAQALTESPYRYRLMLSNRNPDAFTHNLARLNARAPGLEVLTLEDQAFYQGFRQHPNYAQYEAALGNGGATSNYASAADVLRYPMLHSEGGLYMDVDDTLILHPETGKAALDTVQLETTPEGLLLMPPVQNELMGLNSVYNNSMIGSHAGNPTLLAVSQEMRTRYLSAVEPYPVRPNRSTNPVVFKRYAKQLSWLTGPDLLTDVTDRLSPDLYKLRQLSHLYMLPRINTYQFVDLDALKAVYDARLPLIRVARAGHLHSWA
ncbi:dermonecrotic toxin domain-containing protein [Pseudomonas entomophila]|uniref:dermonecrotic toxin domain-containing protein n=1 Tax=Pseudomonas entomophila TaxID=312306 RepID=UPI003EBA73C3